VHVHVSTLLADALDPVLTASVLTAGQTGLPPDEASSDPPRSDGRWPDQSGSVLWCAPYEKLQQKLPALPPGPRTRHRCGLRVRRPHRHHHPREHH
jgi:hypothetical protein